MEWPHWANAGHASTRPYADYYVARFWEDLLAVHQAAVEPTPDDLVPFLRWHPEEWPDLDGDPDAEAASEWLWAHDLDQGHLVNAPRLRLWTSQDAECLSLAWQHGLCALPVFDAPEHGEVVVPAREFTAAVAGLHRELMAAMDARIRTLERIGPPAGVELDLVQLRAEHRDRAQWLQRRLAVPTKTDWPRIRRGVRHLTNSPL